MIKLIGRGDHDGFINWYESLQKNNIIFMFKGDFNQALVNSIVKLVDGLSDLANEGVLARQRMTGTIVESLQNICRHGESPGGNDTVKPGILMLRKKENAYVLDIGNNLSTSKVEHLREYIEKINGLDDEGLKKFHTEVLQNTELFGKYGADLGLINIARKSQKGFEYDFRIINDTYSFFSLEVSISAVMN